MWHWSHHTAIYIHSWVASTWLFAKPISSRGPHCREWHLNNVLLAGRGAGERGRCNLIRWCIKLPKIGSNSHKCSNIFWAINVLHCRWHFTVCLLWKLCTSKIGSNSHPCLNIFWAINVLYNVTFSLFVHWMFYVWSMNCVKASIMYLYLLWLLLYSSCDSVENSK